MSIEGNLSAVLIRLQKVESEVTPGSVSGANAQITTLQQQLATLQQQFAAMQATIGASTDQPDPQFAVPAAPTAAPAGS